LKPLRLLLIEDSEDDALLLILELQKGEIDPDYVRVETPEELESALANNSWDAVIADYNLPAFTVSMPCGSSRQRGWTFPSSWSPG